MTHRSTSRRVLALALPLTALALAGCSRGVSPSSGAAAPAATQSAAAVIPTVAPATIAATAMPTAAPTAAAAAAVNTSAIGAQLNGIDSNLRQINSDSSQANQGLNTTEGDPSSMNSRPMLRVGGTLAAIATLAAATGGVTANAAGSTSTGPSATSSPARATVVGVVRARCAAAISRRQTALNNDDANIRNSGAVTSAHATALDAIISSDRSGLTALNARIAADTSLTELRADCPLIVSDYRVYVLFGPQMHLTLAADRVDAVDGQLTTVAAELQADVNNSSISASLKSAAEKSIADIRSRVAASRTEVATVANDVLAQTPAGYPGNLPILKSAQGEVQSAHSDLTGAAADVNSVLKDLAGK